MIVDRLENLRLYATLHPAIGEVADYIARHDLSALETGKHPIREEDLYVNINQIKALPRSEAKLEAHRLYIDIQIPLEGVETMGYTPTDLCSTVYIPYNEEKDIMFFRGQAQSYLQIEPGMFALFSPQDAHAPGITPTGGKKAIFKIKACSTNKKL